MAGFIARKTEYAGTEFRSKSEAILALYLNEIAVPECEDSAIRFFYEPAQMYKKFDCEWSPDFLVWTDVDYAADCRGDELLHCERAIEFTIIEYKPVIPTNAYLEKLAVDMKQFAKTVGEIFPVSCELWFGGPYDTLPGRMILDHVKLNPKWHSPCGCYSENWKYWPEESVLTSIFGGEEGLFQFLKDYRFDLPFTGKVAGSF